MTTRQALEELGRLGGTLALIFAKAQNKFQDPVKLRRVILDPIDAPVPATASRRCYCRPAHAGV